jgi:hypothetical protein
MRARRSALAATLLVATPAAASPTACRVQNLDTGATGRALRLHDALVLATARVLGADMMLTTDGGWPGTGLSGTVLAPGGP